MKQENPRWRHCSTPWRPQYPRYVCVSF